MTGKKQLTERELLQRKEAALIHGGEGAVRRVSEGRELVGIARQAELDVYDELVNEGRQAIVTRNAARLQACADLFWNAVQKAAQDGDLDRLDHFVSRFGWLSSASLRAWVQVKEEERNPGRPIDVQTVLNAVRNNDNEEPDR